MTLPGPAGSLALRATLMFAEVFAIVASVTLTKTVRDAVFLARFRMHDLATVSLVLALLAGTVAAAYQRLVARRLDRGSGAVASFLGVAISLVGFWAAMRAGLSWVSWGLYLWAGVFGLFVVAQFWITALDVFDAREARRVFPILAAGASLGGAVGGFAAKELADRSGEPGLLVVVALLLVAAAVLAQTSWHIRPRDARPSQETIVTVRAPDGWSAFRSSPLLRNVAAILLCSIVAGTLIDWQIKAAVQAQFHANREAMTEYFGKLAAFASLVSLALQLLTTRLLRRIGIASGLLVLPTVAVAIALLFLGTGDLGISLLSAALIAKSADMGVRYSIDKSALELLYMPIRGAARAAGKALVDTVADRIGGAVTAVIWLGLQVTIDVERPSRIPYASVAVIAVAAVWSVAVFRVRRHYLEAFRLSLARLEIRPEELSRRIESAEAASALATSVRAGNDAEALLALDILADPINRDVAVDVRPALARRQPDLRSRALDVIGMRGDRSAADSVAALLGDGVPAVRVAAIRCFLAIVEPGPVHLRVTLAPSAAGWVSLIAQPTERRARAIESLAASTAPGDRAVAAVLAMGLGCHPIARTLLEDRDTSVARAALGAMVGSTTGDDVPRILEAARRPGFRALAVEALARFGPAVILARTLRSRDALAFDRACVIDALARSRHPSAVGLLAGAAEETKGLERDRVLRGLETLRRETGTAPSSRWIDRQIAIETTGMARSGACAESLRRATAAADDATVGLACRAATEAVDRGIDRIFRLLALDAPAQAIRDAYHGYRHGGPRARAQALEYVDAAIAPSLRHHVMPVLEAAANEPRAARVAAVLHAPLDQDTDDALLSLAQGTEPWPRAAASAALLARGRRVSTIPGLRDRPTDPRIQSLVASVLTAEVPCPI